MRVAFIARSTLDTVPGGDTIQVFMTARFLRAIGIQVDIKLTHQPIDYSKYDLLHFFNITRPADFLKHARCGKPYVVSTIFVDYSEYDKLRRHGWTGNLFRFLSPGSVEYLKAVGRFLKGNDKLISPEYLLLGQNKAVRKILQHAACLLPNSENEYKRLQSTYGINQKYIVVPNGVDTDVFQPRPGIQRQQDMVLCAARIEGIKNQLNLIRALNNTELKLYLIGDPAPNQKDYYLKCKKEAAHNVTFIKGMKQYELAEYYNKAAVHVLPSWFETTGLSSLEAAAMGCNIVISDRGDAKEYFGERAHYCDPSSPASIRDAIIQAARQKADPYLAQIINSKFTWHQAALITVEAYNAIV